MIRNIWILMPLLWMGCTDPYHLPTSATANPVLVVDGAIYASGDSTLVRLTRSENFNDTSVIPVETGARIFLEAPSGGPSYGLVETGNGYYTLPPTVLDQTLAFRLNITLASGHQYLSDYVPVVATPPIDSISYIRVPGTGLTIYANTHDPRNNTRYYKWDYVETYEYHTPFSSQLIYRNHMVQYRDTPVSVCYLSMASTDILIASSASLSSDLIYRAPLELIPEYSVKLGVEYSIIVNQVGLTKEGFNYWQNVQTNSADLGSIFGPQPFQVNGNIHSVSNPKEAVVGFVSVTVPRRQRIFISNAQLGNWNLLPSFCVVDTVTPQRFSSFVSSPGAILLSYYSNGTYLGASGDCADCRYDGGSLGRPPFWP